MNPATPIELPLLIYANPEFVSDLYYLTGLMAPDPFFALKEGTDLTVVVSPLEYGRAVKGSKATEVIDTRSLLSHSEPLVEKEHSSEGANIIAALLDKKIREVQVTRDFPHYLAQELEIEGIRVSMYDTSQLRERTIKNDQEVDYIRDAIRTTESCLARVEEILGESAIENGMLKWEGEWLTSERVHQEIELVCLSRDAMGGNPIVACGDQACDPHEQGQGVLYADQLIIVDIFPRSRVHHYWGDLTRTFLKGKANPGQKRLVSTVAEAQKMAIEKIAEGVAAGSIHQGVEAFFQQQGYLTEVKNGVYHGFFHGTGHGFGLDIHEPPRLGKGQQVMLKAGMVVTVEPGLYYPGIGGCRIEDDILVTKGGYEVLSDFHYNWMIP
jgi:Xaa-Pro aminopeptidase